MYDRVLNIKKEVLMKKNIIYLIMIIFLQMILSACSPSMDYGNTYHPSTDYQHYFHQQGVGAHIAVSENGYYVLNGNYIYYMDKDDMQPVLLDNRPDSDCLQEIDEDQNRNCHAYVEYDELRNGFIAYFDEKLYTLVSKAQWYSGDQIHEAELIEMAKDGTSRKTVLSFNSTPSCRCNSSWEGILQFKRF